MNQREVRSRFITHTLLRLKFQANYQLLKTPDLLSFLICHSNSLMLWSWYILILYSSSSDAHNPSGGNMRDASPLAAKDDWRWGSICCFSHSTVWLVSSHAKPLPFHFRDSPWSLKHFSIFTMTGIILVVSKDKKKPLHAVEVALLAVQTQCHFVYMFGWFIALA